MIPVILLVEDQAAERRAAADLFALLFPEARVVTAESGEQGLALAARSRPTVVVADVHLSGIDAFQFAVALRRLPGAAAIPIVALTGDQTPATLLRAQAAGFAAFLSKPARAADLEGALRPLLGPRQVAEVSSSNRS